MCECWECKQLCAILCTLWLRVLSNPSFCCCFFRRRAVWRLCASAPLQWTTCSTANTCWRRSQNWVSEFAASLRLSPPPPPASLTPPPTSLTFHLHPWHHRPHPWHHRPCPWHHRSHPWHHHPHPWHHRPHPWHHRPHPWHHHPHPWLHRPHPWYSHIPDTPHILGFPSSSRLARAASTTSILMRWQPFVSHQLGKQQQ